jgi:hypothetical protein
MRILDTKFRYVPSGATNVVATWKRFGFRPTTEAERRAQQARLQAARPSLDAAAGAANGRRRGDSKVARLKLAVAE